MTRLLLILALFGLATAAPAQDSRPMNRPVAPFRIAGNLYYVGTAGIASYLITDPAGHVLIDGAMQRERRADRGQYPRPRLSGRGRAHPASTHAHWDHVGGLAALKRLSGARLLASAGDREALDTGRTTYRDDVGTFPPVGVDGSIGDGEIDRGSAARRSPRTSPRPHQGRHRYTLTVTEGRPPARRADRLQPHRRQPAAGRRRRSIRTPRTTSKPASPASPRSAPTSSSRGHTGSFGFDEKRSRLAAGDRLRLRRCGRASRPARPRPRRLRGGAGPPARCVWTTRRANPLRSHPDESRHPDEHRSSRIRRRSRRPWASRIKSGMILFLAARRQVAHGQTSAKRGATTTASPHPPTRPPSGRSWSR